MIYTLQEGQEIDAAVSVCLGQAPAILPFSTDPRSREPMRRWLTENGGCDLARLNSAALCFNVMRRRISIEGDSFALFGDADTRFCATNGALSGLSKDGFDIALARFVLLRFEPAYANAVRALMAEEEARDDEVGEE